MKTNEIENNWNKFLFVGWIVCHRHATLKKSFKKFKSLERDTSFEEELIDRYALASAVLDFSFHKLLLFEPYALLLGWNYLVLVSRLGIFYNLFLFYIIQHQNN